MILTNTPITLHNFFVTKKGLRAPCFLRLIMDSRFSVVELVAKNGGEAEGRDGARGLVGAGAPELNNVS